jgi:DNA adenine methylase
MQSLAFAQQPPPPFTAHPFLKWAGGKTRLLRHILPYFPSYMSHYCEPFVGGGAVFFALAGAGCMVGEACLNDVNSELVAAFSAIRDDVSGVIAALGHHRYEKSYYYAVRDQDPAALSPSELAARMVCLNKTGFNGLYRVNKSGKFNVPFGRYSNPTICDEENLRAVSAALQGAHLVAADFADVLAKVETGWVYVDPPYVPLTLTSNFTGYAANGFSFADQVRLREAVVRLRERGVRGIASNSDTEVIRDLYTGFTIRTVKANPAINSKGTGRGPVNEVLISW